MDVVLNKVRVGVVRGGNKNHTVSIREGAKMLSYIEENLPNKCQAFDVFVDKDKVWHFKGMPILPMDLLKKVDVIWDTTSPSLSGVLETYLPIFKIPTFSSVMASSKELLKEHIKTANILIPAHIVLSPYKEDIDGPLDLYVMKKSREVHAKFGAPWIVRPYGDDENVAIHVARTFPDLMRATEDLAKHHDSILVEELIAGKRGGVHNIANFRGEGLYQMLPYEIRKHGIEPAGNFSDEQNRKLYDLGEKLFKHLGADTYLHFTFVITKRDKIYITEVDFLPNVGPHSSLSLSANTVGSDIHEIVNHFLPQIGFTEKHVAK